MTGILAATPLIAGPAGLIATAEASGPESSPGRVDAVWSAYQKRWEATDTYTAAFSQSIEIDGIAEGVSSGGQFYFSRPDRMRFDYTEGQDQAVVGDGHWIWVYQPDLEQVYKVEYETAFGSGGLVALLGDRSGLSARYNLSLLDSPAGVVRLLLTPKAEIGETLELAMSADTFDLRTVVMTDPAGSITRVEFDEVRRNVALDKELFAFDPPSGVDIIEGGN